MIYMRQDFFVEVVIVGVLIQMWIWHSLKISQSWGVGGMVLHIESLMVDVYCDGRGWFMEILEELSYFFEVRDLALRFVFEDSLSMGYVQEFFFWEAYREYCCEIMELM